MSIYEAFYNNKRWMLAVSKVIFLNRCGSSSKTFIVKIIQYESPDLWLAFGVDTFIDMIPFGRQEPYLKFIPVQNERGSTMHLVI